MTQLALWLGFATIALAVATFVYFAVRAGQSGLIPFYYRGHLATALGIGDCARCIVRAPPDLTGFRGWACRRWPLAPQFGSSAKFGCAPQRSTLSFCSV